MTIEELGSLGEFVGAIATVGTLVYLAVQIREHNLFSRRQALDTVLERAARWYEVLNQNPDLLDLYLTARETFSCLEEREQWRFHSLMMTIFAVYEGGLESAKQHAVKNELVLAMKTAICLMCLSTLLTQNHPPHVLLAWKPIETISTTYSMTSSASL